MHAVSTFSDCPRAKPAFAADRFPTLRSIVRFFLCLFDRAFERAKRLHPPHVLECVEKLPDTFRNVRERGRFCCVFHQLFQRSAIDATPFFTAARNAKHSLEMNNARAREPVPITLKVPQPVIRQAPS